SQLHLRIAQARARGDRETVRALRKECRQYASCRTVEWLRCEEIYLRYLRKPFLYRDWSEQAVPDVSRFGVVDFRLPRLAKVAVVGDWGTGLPDAAAMVDRIVSDLSPDALIHLGDIYYSGTPDECQANVARVLSRLSTPVPTFMIPGNHDY